jgi:KDO2-lipid IV(A) lauroyltransferase
VIFALPHVGSWDVAAAFAQALELKLTVVTESNWVTELVAGSRTQHGVTLAPRDRSLRPLFQALRRNECVVMLSDVAHEGIQTMDVDFFGRPAPFPMGPARLAQRTGAPILVVTSVRQDDGTYLIAAGEPLVPDDSHPPEEEIARLTAEVACGFERIIRNAPDQWYPFGRVWRE